MATFLTGSTGFLGSYLAANLLREDEKLNVLVRAKDREEGARRLWKSLQLHFDFAVFEEHLADRIEIFAGDLTRPDFGLDPDDRRRLVSSTDSVIHCAASLNRRSERTCMNVNLRGTLAVAKLARAAHEDHGLRRFSQVSTVSVAGTRQHETVHEDEAIDWARRDYDAYARTKKFAEHLVRELLNDLPITIFRPSIILGDSRRPETTQFDMVRAFSVLAGLPFLPLRPLDRIDIVPVNWVADCVTTLHRKIEPGYDTYHLSAGGTAERYHAITAAIAGAVGHRAPIYLPALEKPFESVAKLLARAGWGNLRRGATLLEVFYPYLTYDTVFDSSRAIAETGAEPAPFTSYCVPLLRFSREHGFRYPHDDWPASDAGPRATDEASTNGTSTPRSLTS